MIRQGLLTAAVLVLPQIATAATLGPLAEVAPYAGAITAGAYLFSGAEATWYGKKALAAYRHRDTDGMNAVWENMAVAGIGLSFITLIIPRLVAPLVALAGTVS